MANPINICAFADIFSTVDVSGFPALSDCSNQLRLSENDFISCRQAALAPNGLIGGLHCREFARSRQTFGTAGGDIVRADGFEIRREAAHSRVCQCIALDIEYRRRKTSA